MAKLKIICNECNAEMVLSDKTLLKEYNPTVKD